MRIEDMPRPWLLAAVTGVPMTALLERADQELAEWQEAMLRDHEAPPPVPDRDHTQGHRNNVVMLPSWQ
jgi:hypothetical protein